MLMQISDIYDRASILQVKSNNGFPVKHLLNRYLKELENYDRLFFNELVATNTIMFNLENSITKATTNEEVGRLYRKLRQFTWKRAKIKNKITKRYGGNPEIKRY